MYKRDTLYQIAWRLYDRTVNEHKKKFKTFLTTTDFLKIQYGERFLSRIVLSSVFTQALACFRTIFCLRSIFITRNAIFFVSFRTFHPFSSNISLQNVHCENFQIFITSNTLVHKTEELNGETAPSNVF